MNMYNVLEHLKAAFLFKVIKNSKAVLRGMPKSS